MTTRNDDMTEPIDHVDDTILDELLTALKTDMGGARTVAIRRALTSGDEYGPFEYVAEDAEFFFDSDHSGLTTLADIEQAMTAASEIVDEIEADIFALTERDVAYDQRLATVEASLTQLHERFSAVESQLEARRGEIEQVHQEFDQLAADYEVLAVRLDAISSDVNERVEAVEASLDRRFKSLERRIDDLETTVKRQEAETSQTDELDDVRRKLAKAIHDLQRDVKSSMKELHEDVEKLESQAESARAWRESVADGLKPNDRRP